MRIAELGVGAGAAAAVEVAVEVAPGAAAALPRETGEVGRYGDQSQAWGLLLV